MTLLSIIQDATDEIGLDRPSTVVANPASEIVDLLRYARRVGSDLVTRADWQALRKEQTFTGVAGEAQANAIPADFARMIPETFWDRTNIRLVTFPIQASQWQSLKATLYSGPDLRATRRGNAVLFIPPLVGGEALSYEYLTANYCTSNVGVGQSSWAADTDLPVLPRELFVLGVAALYSAAKGLDQKAALLQRAYELRIVTEIGNDQPNARVLSAGDIFGGGRRFGGAPAADFYSGTL